MIDALYQAFGVGVEASHLSILQVVLRGVLIFFVALGLVRLADKRFFAKRNAFDVILGFVLSSMLARAINGSEQLGPTIAAGLALVLLHRGIGWVACTWPSLGTWIKGHSSTLIEDGQIDHGRLQKHHMEEHDLREELRLNGIEEPEQVKAACLERNGQISVIKRES